MLIQEKTGRALPRFVAEPSSIVKLPLGRTLGAVTGLAVAPDDGHIWIMHIASILEWGPPGQSKDPAARLPPVVEFDAEGNFLQAWGGTEHLSRLAGRAQWPKQEETISIDAEGMLWIFGANKGYDHAVQRFTRDGKLLLRIGEFGVAGNDESRDHLGCPTDAYHDVSRREVYISDGYVNHRVAVFNSDTGEFLRAWGAYGKRAPFPESGRETFNNPVHAISLGPEGHLYVCDRKNDRIQVFDAIGSSEPRFVRELDVKAESPFGTTSTSPSARAASSCSWPMAAIAGSGQLIARPGRSSVHSEVRTRTAPISPGRSTRSQPIARATCCWDVPTGESRKWFFRAC